MRRHCCTCCRSAGRTTAGMRWPLENVPVSAASRETASVTTFSGPSAADHAFSASSSCELRMPLPSCECLRRGCELGRIRVAPLAAEDDSEILFANNRSNSQIGHQTRNAVAIFRIRGAGIEPQNLHQTTVLRIVVRADLLTVGEHGGESDALQDGSGTMAEGCRGDAGATSQQL